ncbi:MAG: NUDIX domain-containing protein [Patescibacteria group bacterium]
MSKFTIVNEQDEVIGYKDLSMITGGDINRSAALWITNDEGKILLAKRALMKEREPGVWGPAVAGMIEEGETYYSNIVKEAEEEIGLKGIQPTEGPKIRVSQKHNYFCQWYLLVFNGSLSDLKIQEEEVSELKWFSPEELKRQLINSPEQFIDSANGWIEWFRL